MISVQIWNIIVLLMIYFIVSLNENVLLFCLLFVYLKRQCKLNLLEKNSYNKY